ncbi:sigma-54 interaction domain-containing protein [candidate division KSB1 bacterium]
MISNKNHQMHELILDSVADGVFTVDTEWKITSFNKAAERILGVSRNDAVGRKCCDVFKADICDKACALKRTIENSEEIINQRVTVRDKNDRTIPISISTAILYNENGSVMGGVETFRDLAHVEMLRREISKQYTFQDIISKSHEIKKIFDVLPDIARSESTVLIEGSSGTGKELFARALHNLSYRKNKPYIVVNCGALPDTLLESELFGYVKGAFTDARKDKPGRFTLAEGGTIFLDEVGDIAQSVQVKLLRVLQEKEYEPLGSVTTHKADVRIIAATNKDLYGLVKKEIFRDDLYYRLNVFKIKLPLLSKRRQDIPLLIEHFIHKYNARTGKAVERVSQETIDILMQHEYAGNVRELENIIEHAFVLCRGPVIEVAHIPKELITTGHRHSAPAIPFAENPLESAEAAVIQDALVKYSGDRSKTAKALGLHKTTLWRKMKKLNITHPVLRDH